jgi:DNA-binding CsgD family transcriptional regulator/tetratricopeptide (TPR) repeat protein
MTKVRAGQSQVLCLRGEAGVGKTALMDYLLERASGCRIARATGIESEMELAFAGLHQLCTPMLDCLGRLPGPQRNALAAVSGLTAGGPVDRFLVGLSVLSLLAEVAEEQPLVCLIDDAHWLDRVSAQTLAFVARRLMAERIALVFVVRDPSDHEFAGLPELVIRGLADADAHALLDSVISGPVDERIRGRIVAETRGNPLALQEYSQGLTSAELAFGFGLPDSMPTAGRLEQGFLRRLQPLPRDTRQLLLTAAVEPLGDVTLLWRAVERLGVGVDAAAPAEAAGLIELGPRVRFRHPLVRSAACRAAGVRDLQQVHRALAEVTDSDLDPDRRAWHRAFAAVGPDEGVAAELARSADRARSRSGIAAAAAFMARATELTPDPARRGVRALAAARAKFDAGVPQATLELLASAELCPLDTLQQARLERLRAQLIFARRRGNDSPPLLLDAAKRLEPLDIGLARETYLEALGAGIRAGCLHEGLEMREVADAARAAPPGPAPPRALDLLLDGLAMRFTDGYAAGVPPLRRALQAFAREQESREEDMLWHWLASPVAAEVWDDEAWHQLTTRAVRSARNAGALTVLPMALMNLAGAHLHAGQFASVSALTEEANAINEATGQPPFLSTSLVLVAWRGQETQALQLIEAGIHDATARGDGRTISLAEFARAVLYNGLGRYQAALIAAQRACEHDDLGLVNWALTELVEASARSGRLDVAAAALWQLEERTRAGGTNWALGIEARSRALVSDDDVAEHSYREAIERLTNSRITVHLARAQLVYGEWLRRESRRVDARVQLRAAHEVFSRIGADGFAERTRRELLATGERVRKRTVEMLDEFTAQEAQIARLAGDGHTNPEIGAELFISPRTVEWHLRKVFTKLGISSRKELRGALRDT